MQRLTICEGSQLKCKESGRASVGLLAGYRKWEGVALSLQSLIQGRSEKEVVWRRVFYSQHSLPKNKKIKQQKTSQLCILYRGGLCSPQNSIG